MEKANCYLFFCIAPTVSHSSFLPVGKNYTTKKGQLRCPFNKYLQSAGPSDLASRYFLKTKEKSPRCPPKGGTARGGPTAKRQTTQQKRGFRSIHFNPNSCLSTIMNTGGSGKLYTVHCLSNATSYRASLKFTLIRTRKMPRNSVNSISRSGQRCAV